MRAIKIFNNNAVATIMKDKREAIVIGNGIGFNKRMGDTLDEERIEKIYYVHDEMQTKFLQMLQNVKPEMMEAAEKILQLAIDNNLKLSNQGTISLIDHISFAVERAKEKVYLPNLMLSEIRMLYPKEFSLGKKALDCIEEACDVRLPEDEAGYIALHLVNVSVDKDDAYNTLKFVKGSLDIIKNCYQLKWDESGLDMMRLTTHLKFLAQRIFNHESWQDDKMSSMYDYLIESHKKNRDCLNQLNDYIQKEFHYTLERQEEIYLLVHLTKIL